MPRPHEDRCSWLQCNGAVFLPCHVCGVPLCADHGLTRLLINHCVECARKEGGTFHTQREIGAQLAARQHGAARPAPPEARHPEAPPRRDTTAKSVSPDTLSFVVSESGFALLKQALTKRRKG